MRIHVLQWHHTDAPDVIELFLTRQDAHDSLTQTVQNEIDNGVFSEDTDQDLERKLIEMVTDGSMRDLIDVYNDEVELVQYYTRTLGQR